MSCPEINLDAWSDTLLAPLHQNERYPISATMDLTERCNLNCVHCYINQPSGSKIAHAKELKTDQVKQILDTIADAGCLFLVLTGGDPLLRPDFSEVYIHARRRGFIIDLLTNATLITPKIADMLAESRPHSVDVTLYGASEETYEAVTRLPGSFKRLLNGLDLLTERGIRLSLKSIILKTNRHELPALIDLAKSYDAPFRYDGIIWPRLDGDQSPYEYQLSPEELLEMDLEYPNRAEEWREQAQVFKGQMVRKEYIYTCGAGLRSFHVDSHGKMSICTMARKPAYDLTKIRFEEAWDRLADLRHEKRTLNTPCETCLAGALCAQCPGWSQAVHGDDETPAEFICKLGKLRAEQFSSSILYYEEMRYENQEII
ncbi:MAG: radical SAM protein [Brevefilum sp.]|nr:radical SAM protein [Brevefilum sp.]